MFQAAVMRLRGEGFAPPIVITAEPFRFVVQEQLQSLDLKAAEVLIEPEPRNTGPAIAAALAWVAKHDPEGVMLIAPSDHVIEDSVGFRDCVRRATATAGSHIVIFGITPTYAETGYGWLELESGQNPEAETPQTLSDFVEKPNSEVASRMLSSGSCLWNSGIFLASIPVLRRAYEQTAPELLLGAERAYQNGAFDLEFFRLDAEVWNSIKAISIDHGVMENAQGLKVQRWTGGWTDLGSWDSVARRSAASHGETTEIDCKNSYLAAGDGVRLVGIGLTDMIAVALPDAVLVAPRSAAQEVGRVVEAMAAEDVPQATEFPKEHRPWGSFETLALGGRFKVKRLVVKPGGRLSLQSHMRRAEHWVVVEGTVFVTISGKRRRLGENQSLYVPVEAQHRLENESDQDAVLIEVQTGAYLGEDDIVRYDDAYARK